MENQLMDRADRTVRNPNAQDRAERDAHEKRDDELTAEGLELELDEFVISMAWRKTCARAEVDHVSEEAAYDDKNRGESEEDTDDVREDDGQLEPGMDEVVTTTPEFHN